MAWASGVRMGGGPGDQGSSSTLSASSSSLKASSSPGNHEGEELLLLVDPQPYCLTHLPPGYCPTPGQQQQQQHAATHHRSLPAACRPPACLMLSCGLPASSSCCCCLMVRAGPACLVAVHVVVGEAAAHTRQRSQVFRTRQTDSHKAAVASSDPPSPPGCLWCPSLRVSVSGFVSLFLDLPPSASSSSPLACDMPTAEEQAGLRLLRYQSGLQQSAKQEAAMLSDPDCHTPPSHQTCLK